MDSCWCADVDGAYQVTIDKRADFHLQCVIEFGFYGESIVVGSVNALSNANFPRTHTNTNAHEPRFMICEKWKFIIAIGQQTTVNEANERMGKYNRKSKINIYRSVPVEPINARMRVCIELHIKVDEPIERTFI